MYFELKYEWQKCVITSFCEPLGIFPRENDTFEESQTGCVG